MSALAAAATVFVSLYCLSFTALRRSGTETLVPPCPANGGYGVPAHNERTGPEREPAGCRAGGEEASAAGLEARVAKRAAAEPLGGFQRAFPEPAGRRTEVVPAVQRPLTAKRVGFGLAADPGGPAGPLLGRRRAVAPG